MVGLIPLPAQLNKLLKKFTFLFIFFTFFLPSISISNIAAEKLNFNVYRNGSLIGYHNLDFYEKDSLIESKIEIKFEVTFLGFVVYEYFHKNLEKWINFKPSTSIDEGIKKFISWYLSYYENKGD